MLIFIVFLLATYFGGAHLQGIKPEEFIVAVLEENKPICAGAFLHKNYVVTSANCVHNKRDLVVAIGSAAQNNARNKKAPVVSTYLHPYYRAPTLDYDVALLKVNTVGAEGSIKPLNLPKTALEKLDIVTMGGWDATEREKKFVTTACMVVSKSKCAEEMSKMLNVNNKLFCLNKLNSKFQFIEGNPATYVTYDGKNKDLMGIGVKDYNVNNNQNSFPMIYVNLSHQEIASFIRTYVN